MTNERKTIVHNNCPLSMSMQNARTDISTSNTRHTVRSHSFFFDVLCIYYLCDLGLFLYSVGVTPTWLLKKRVKEACSLKPIRWAIC